MLVHGDNLPAMKALARTFAGKIRAIYLDPPFNTQRRFAEYADAREAAAWAAFMRPRLACVRDLLSDDGAAFVEIDDTELATLIVLLDEIFGANNRVSTITVVRSASTGHKAINKGPVNVADYLLVYAKDRARVRLTPQTRAREGHDWAYTTWLENPDDPCGSWRYAPLGKIAARALGFASSVAGTRALGAERFRGEVARFALENAANVVRFAQPRYEAIGAAMQRVVDRSRAEPGTTFRLERHPHKDFLVRSGNRVLFLRDKVEGEGRASRLVEPLTNVWTDISFQGIAREGGVVFSRNKKPERLLRRVLSMSTDPGDWVLDPFAGSGTTCAVAHKMGRRFVGIEEGDHLFSLAVPRLERVVRGEDATGVTKETGFGGGGGFGVFRV
jgi:adenine-specific DNA-methyltransferase